MVAAGYLRGGCLEATEEQARCCAVRFTGCAATRAGRVGCESEPGALNSEARVSRSGAAITTHTTRGDGSLGPILDFADCLLALLAMHCMLQLEAALAAQVDRATANDCKHSKSDIY